MVRKKNRTLLLLAVICALSLLVSACEKAPDTIADKPADEATNTSTDTPPDNSAGPSQEQAWDNPSYYVREISHPLAETEAGYYVFLNNLLYYVDKSSLEAVLLSGQAYTPEELFWRIEIS